MTEHNPTLDPDPDPQELADQLADDVKAMRRYTRIVLSEGRRPAISARGEMIRIELPPALDLFAEIADQLRDNAEGTYTFAGVDMGARTVYFEPRGLAERDD